MSGLTTQALYFTVGGGGWSWRHAPFGKNTYSDSVFVMGELTVKIPNLDIIEGPYDGVANSSLAICQCFYLLTWIIGVSNEGVRIP